MGGAHICAASCSPWDLLSSRRPEGLRSVGQTLASAQSHQQEPSCRLPLHQGLSSLSYAKPTELEGFELQTMMPSKGPAMGMWRWTLPVPCAATRPHGTASGQV